MMATNMKNRDLSLSLARLDLCMPRVDGVDNTSSHVFQGIHGLLYLMSNHLIPQNAQNSLLELFDNLINTESGKRDFKQAIRTSERCATSAGIVEKLFRLSADHSHVALTRLCLELGAAPYAGDQLLQMCHCPPSPELLDLLIEFGTQIPELVLVKGLAFGPNCILQYLIQHEDSLDMNFDYGPVLNGSPGFWQELEPYVWDWLCKSIKMTPLALAALSKQPNSNRVLAHFLARNAAPNLDAMIAAAYRGNLQAICLLHGHGAPVDGLARYGISPLMAAVMRFNNDIQLQACSLLLNLGARPSVRSNHPQHGRVPSELHILCNTSPQADILVLDLFINAGFDIDYRVSQRFLPGPPQDKQFLSSPFHHDLIPETPLEWAISGGNYSVASHLIFRECRLTGRELLFRTQAWIKHDESFESFVRDVLLKDPGQSRAQDADSLTVFQRAISCGNVVLVEALLNSGIEAQPRDILHGHGRFLMGLQETDMGDPCPLPPCIQLQLLCALPDLENTFHGQSPLEILCKITCKEALRLAFSRFPDAYDSGALCAIVIRVVGAKGSAELEIADLKELLDRRLKRKRDERKENTAVAIAALAGRFDVVEILTDLGSRSGLNDAHFMAQTLHFIVSGAVVYGYMDEEDDGEELRDFAWADSRDWPTEDLRHRWYNEFGGITGIESSPLTSAVVTGTDEAVETMIEHLLSRGYHPDGFTYVACASRNRLATLRRFQDLRFDITQFDNRPRWCPTSLQLAVCQGHTEMVHLLIKAGAVVDDREKPPDMPCTFFESYTGILPRTALQAAVQAGRMDLITILINAGASVNAPAARDSGATALQIASIKGYLPLARYLIDQGADVNAPGAPIRGRTALQGAAERGRLDLVKFLLVSGAATNNEYRESYVKAVLYAEKGGHLVLARMLREDRPWSSEDYHIYSTLESDWDGRRGDFRHMLNEGSSRWDDSENRCNDSTGDDDEDLHSHSSDGNTEEELEGNRSPFGCILDGGSPDSRIQDTEMADIEDGMYGGRVDNLEFSGEAIATDMMRQAELDNTATDAAWDDTSFGIGSNEMMLDSGWQSNISDLGWDNNVLDGGPDNNIPNSGRDDCILNSTWDINMSDSRWDNDILDFA